MVKALRADIAVIAVCGRLSHPVAPPRRCRIDMNSASDQADRRPGQRLFQPCLPFAIRNGPVQHRQQRFDLAEFRRPLVTGPVNRALEQPKPDFLGQPGKGAGVESEA